MEVSNSGIEVKSLLFPPKQIETKIKFWVKDQVIIPEGTTPGPMTQSNQKNMKLRRP